MRAQLASATTRVVNAEMRNWVFVRVETDQPGVYGWGEATLEWKTRAVVGAVEDIAPLVIGRDPQGQAFALRDACPHRGTALGKGTGGPDGAGWAVAGAG